MFPKALSYKIWAVIFTVFSFVVSNFGLSKIINYSLPVLMFLYPLAITLILLALTGRFFGHDRAVYVSVTAFTCAAAVLDLLKTLPAGMKEAFSGIVALAERYLPFFSINLGWVIPAAVGLIVGLLIRRLRK